MDHTKSLVTEHYDVTIMDRKAYLQIA